MNELSEGGKQLKSNIELALNIGPVVRINTQEFADAEAMTLRTAQRRIKEMHDVPEFKFGPRGKGSVTIMRASAPPIGDFLKTKHSFKTPVEIDEEMPDVVLDVVLSSLSYLYIYIYLRKEDLRRKRQNDTGNDSDDISASNGHSIQAAEYWVEDTSGAMSELVGMVCYVCRLSALLLLDEDEAKITKLFRAGATGAKIQQHYSRDKRPNFWYNGWWKGRDKNAYPTIVDIMATWEMAADYRPQKHDSWPPFKEIIATIEKIMGEYGHKRPESAMKALEEYGYDEIIKHIKGGYVYLIRLDRTKCRIHIATAIREIRQESRELVQE